MVISSSARGGASLDVDAAGAAASEEDIGGGNPSQSIAHTALEWERERMKVEMVREREVRYRVHSRHSVVVCAVP